MIACISPIRTEERVGAIVPVDQGPAGDYFFLSFDQFGAFSHAFVEPTYTATAAVPGTPQPDMGIATFERIYHTMSGITGVPFTNSARSRIETRPNPCVGFP